MRRISIHIAKIADDDVELSITENANPHNLYNFIQATLNYSVFDSAITSELVLSMREPPTEENILQSGQTIQIQDNGEIVFEGILNTVQTVLTPMTGQSQGGIYALITLSPSIEQLTITPLIYDQNQASQISELTGVNTTYLLAGEVAQTVETSKLLEYMISNTFYSTVFNKTISSEDLSDNIFLMAAAGDTRDTVLRTSIDFYNCVLYQKENGTIQIRQLDASLIAPFAVDLRNQYVPSDGQLPQETLVPILQWAYSDSAYTTPCVVSNYALVPANLSISGGIDTSLISYTPNNLYFPRLAALKKAGWFVGSIGQAQINQNIVTNPTAATALAGFQARIDQYMQKAAGTGYSNDFLSSYQALLTAKQLAFDLTRYASFFGQVSLDDPHLPDNLGEVIGRVINIQNCKMKQGLIAESTRTYSAKGSYLSFHVVPLGSFTGYWKNSL